MARKRFIAPEFFTHRALYKAEKKTRLPLRIAYAGLWTQADRRGIFRWQPDSLQASILPYDRCEMVDVLNALDAHCFIGKYTVAGEWYGLIPKLARWQHFHVNERASKDPGPPDGVLDTILARCQHGASTPTAVTVTDPTAVTAVSSEMEPRAREVDGAAGVEAPAPSTRSVVNDVAAALSTPNGQAVSTKGKRLPAPPPPGIHAALVDA